MTNKYNIEYPWFNKVLNPNSRKHWAVVASAKKKQRQSARLLTKGKPKPIDYDIDIIFNPPCNRKRDKDNCLAAIKGLLDGVADAWGVDDHLFNPRIKWGQVVKNGSIIIEYNIE